ncbi:MULTISPECIES: hypothetical protein [Methylococcus]|jgi:hypothetical protein|uniref:Uncharacterized protein n=2 Tax=Methylococcus capsulatus TaxID=414 RepID=Q60BI4_METCA|nr:hypothetical protein [Methylococcus capsulatus]AAU93211.1 hypothetical protein MCA0488 [Methylococcus capsulatus str. Bath]QXP88692.1 hypothetical protein KW112_06195 [Methylococcus capsulatus]QXP89926.1 hypothetical protein KW114_12745 [Methylococcus capsulatus]QXP94276.1 hypothetical protein KW113_03440 [Methylococcus capsulatus]UQN10970.1 hypothetical protein M3M30_07920 [Methylococcus capsulatus]
MNHIDTLIRLINQGFSAQVMLKDGSMIRGFRPHDIIARGGVSAGVVVARGLVGGEDRIVPLCDVSGVFSERPRRVLTTDAGFFQRNPVPRGWTRLHPLAVSDGN